MTGRHFTRDTHGPQSQMCWHCSRQGNANEAASASCCTAPWASTKLPDTAGLQVCCAQTRFAAQWLLSQPQLSPCPGMRTAAPFKATKARKSPHAWQRGVLVLRVTSLDNPIQ